MINLVALQTTNVTRIPPEEEKRNCYWKKVWYHCIALSLDIAYYGEGASDTITLDVKFNLDTGSKLAKRARMVDTGTNKLVSQTVRELVLQRNQTTKVEVVVYVSVELSVKMQQNITLESSFEARHDPAECGDIPCGILNAYASNSAVSIVRYQYTYLSFNYCFGNDGITANFWVI